MSDPNGWSLIESDPGVFTELISELGFKNLQVEEIIDLSPESICQFGKVYGLIFLFKYDAKMQKKYFEDMKDKQVENTDLYFAKQVVTNACATQAILSILLNIEEMELPSSMVELKSFSSELPPEFRGEVIGSDENIRKAHNSFSSATEFLSERLSDKFKGQKEDPFHFISYVPFKDGCYEMDGLQQCPINLGSTKDTDWIELAVENINRRITSYVGNELRFSVMSVVESPINSLQARIQQLEASNNSESDPTELMLLNDQLDHLKQNQEVQQLNNKIKRHNYLPFIFNLLGELAESGKLGPALLDPKNRESLNDQNS